MAITHFSPQDLNTVHRSSFPTWNSASICWPISPSGTFSIFAKITVVRRHQTQITVVRYVGQLMFFPFDVWNVHVVRGRTNVFVFLAGKYIRAHQMNLYGETYRDIKIEKRPNLFVSNCIVARKSRQHFASLKMSVPCVFYRSKLHTNRHFDL